MGTKELIVIGLIAAIGMTIALFVSVEAYRACPALGTLDLTSACGLKINKTNCTVAEADAKLGSLMSVLAFPIAAAVGCVLNVHVDSGKKSAANVNDAIEEALLIDGAMSILKAAWHSIDCLLLSNMQSILTMPKDTLSKLLLA